MSPAPGVRMRATTIIHAAYWLLARRAALPLEGMRKYATSVFSRPTSPVWTHFTRMEEVDVDHHSDDPDDPDPDPDSDPDPDPGVQ